MKKILHIQLLPLISGAQRVCLDELTRLDENEFERYLICSQSGPLVEEAERNGVKCILLPNLRREISPLRDFRVLLQLFFVMRKYRFDIVHTHSSKTGVLGRIAAKIARVKKIVHTVHGFSFPAAKNKIEKFLFYFMERLGVLCGDILICLHEDDKQTAVNVLKARENRVVVLPNGVDTDLYHKYSMADKRRIRMSLNIPEGAFVIGMVGRLWRQKDPLTLLKAFADIVESEPNAHLVFVGDGELRGSIEDKISSHPFRKNVHILGWRSDTYDVLNSFDIFVLPSLYEGMPLAIIEAMSSGLPCVVSDIPGNRHLIHDGETGLLFKVGDSKGLVDKIKILIKDDELLAHMSHTGVGRVIDFYNIKKRVSSLIELYSIENNDLVQQGDCIK